MKVMELIETYDISKKWKDLLLKIFIGLEKNNTVHRGVIQDFQIVYIFNEYLVPKKIEETNLVLEKQKISI